MFCRNAAAYVCAFLLIPAAVFSAEEGEEAVAVFRSVQGSVVGLESVASSGTGIILDRDGVILTNAHVVALPLNFKCLVDVKRGDKYETVVFKRSKVLGVHPTLDLALIKIDPAEHKAELQPAVLRKEQADTGQRVYAIGNPGTSRKVKLTKTITSGLLSGVDRIVDDVSYYQFSAPVSSGNSGGPLCDRNGQILGIVTLKLTDVDNVGFALPLDSLNRDDFKPIGEQKGDPDKAKQIIASCRPIIAELNRLNDLGEKESLKGEVLRLLLFERYQEALLLNPADPDPYQIIGQLLGESDDFDAAEAFFLRGLEIAAWGDDAGLYRAYGIMKKRQNKADEALTIWLEGVAKHPLDGLLWQTLTSYYVDQKDHINTAAAGLNALNSRPAPHKSVQVSRPAVQKAIHTALRLANPQDRQKMELDVLDAANDMAANIVRQTWFRNTKRPVITPAFASFLKDKGFKPEDLASGPLPDVNDDCLPEHRHLLLDVKPAEGKGGEWTLENDVLTSPIGSYARLGSTARLGDVYDIVFEVERLSGAGEVALGFQYQGKPAVCVVDFGGTKTGIAGLKDGLHTSPVLNQDQPVQLIVRIRKNSLTIKADGKTLLRRDGDNPFPPPSAKWALPATTTTFIGVNQAKIAVHGWAMIAKPKADDDTAEAAPSSSVVSDAPRPKRLESPAKPISQFQLQAMAGVREVAVSENTSWGLHSLAFSPDGRLLAGGKPDDAIWLFDAKTGARLTELEKLKDIGDVQCIAFTPDGKRLLAGGYRGKVGIWSVEKDQLIPYKQFVGHSSQVSVLQISRDGKFALSGGAEKRLRYWEIETGAELAAFAFEDGLQIAALHPDGLHAIASDGKVLLTINLQTKEIVSRRSLSGYGGSHAMAISADAARVAYFNFSAIVVMDLATGLTSEMKAEGVVWGMQFSPDGRTLYSGGTGEVSVWDHTKQQRIGTLSIGELYVKTIAVSDNGRNLASICSAAGQELHIFELPETLAGAAPEVSPVAAAASKPAIAEPVVTARVEAREIAHTQNVGWAANSLAVSPDGKWTAVGGRDNVISIFDTHTGALNASSQKLDRAGAIHAMSVSADGKRLLCGYDQGTIVVWNVDKQRQLSKFKQFVGHTERVEQIVISPDGKHALSGGHEKRLRYWEIETCTERAVFELDHQLVAVAFDPSGKHGLACDGEQVLDFDLVSRKRASVRRLLDSGQAQSAAFSADGQKIAYSHNYDIHVFDLSTGLTTQEMPTGGIIGSLKFSPDGVTLFSGDRNSLSVWNIVTQQRTSMLSIPGDPYFKSADISANGKIVAMMPGRARSSIYFYEMTSK